MRLLAVLLVSAAALLAVSAGSSSPTLAQARICTPANVSFHIQILGDRTWGWQIGRVNTIPTKVTTIAVWSMGGPAASRGIATYGWATRTRFGFYEECRPGTAPRQLNGKLSAPVSVKDGWYDGRKFTCIDVGRIVVAISDTKTGKRVTVRAYKTGKLLALGEITRGGGWLRGSTSCEESGR